MTDDAARECRYTCLPMLTFFYTLPRTSLLVISIIFTIVLTQCLFACFCIFFFFFFQAEDGIRDDLVTGVQTCALPILFSFLSSWLNSSSVLKRLRTFLTPSSTSNWLT